MLKIVQVGKIFARKSILSNISVQSQLSTFPSIKLNNYVSKWVVASLIV